MTPADVKASPLKRGDFLIHKTLGTVAYARKIRGNPDYIIVTHTHNAFTGAQNSDVRVALSEVERHKRGRGAQKARLILAVCPDCGLKIRTTRGWLELGTPRCFNEQCSASRYFGDDGMIRVGRLLEIEYEKQDADMRAVGKTMQVEHYGREVDFSNLDPFQEEQGK